MIYVFEKGCSMPLCGCIGEDYYKFDDGEIITNPNVINFINEGLKLKTMSKKEVDLTIYKILNEKGTLYGYRYVLNGVNNLLDPYKQPFSPRYISYVTDKLFSGEYTQELLWGEDNWKKK